ncbi:metadherin a [Lepisosteus oculatus]|uniref:metadherin a n=1 Tax=Lepisosteus oculatus TaxID=7918 RepID=UPI0035F5019F
MAASWQEVATRQAEEISSRLRELLSSGLGLLRSELGVDLGLKPELYPSWVLLLLTAFLGLLGVAAVWAAACAGLVGGRKRGARAAEPTSQGAKAAAAKAGKPEEQKKRNKKKPVDKKAQPNGRTIVELQEDDVKAAAEDVLKQAAEVKTEKTKKNKKKPKAEAKQAQNASSADGKEPDEGTWETKVSNREKRQQRRRDKGLTEDSGSPGEAAPASPPAEQPAALAPAPPAARKSKGDLHRNKPGKDAVISQVSASWTEAPAVNGGGWNDMAMKLPAQLSGVNGETWSSASEAPPRRSLEPAAWGQGTEGSWTTVDARMKKPDLNPSSFTALGLTPAVTGAEPGSQTNADLQWDGGQHKVADEWSGLNGLSSVDPTSDWNAPAELWGNYEEEPEAQTPAQPQEPETELQKVSDEEKEKVDSAAAGGGKSKKKKKKKKKQGEEANAALQETEEQEKESWAESEAGAKPARREQESDPSAKTASSKPAEVRTERAVPAVTPLSAPVQERVSQKTPSQVPQRPSGPEPAVPTAKQNSVPPPSQKKPEENWESPKQVKKKKKARRET